MRLLNLYFASTTPRQREKDLNFIRNTIIVVAFVALCVSAVTGDLGPFLRATGLPISP